MRKMAELDREMTLVELSSQIDGYKMRQTARRKADGGGEDDVLVLLKKMSEIDTERALAVLSSLVSYDYKLEKMAIQKTEKPPTRKDSSPTQPSTKMDRWSTRDELRAKRMIEQDEESDRKWFEDLLNERSSPSWDRAESPPSYKNNDDGDNRGRRNEHWWVPDDNRDDLAD